MPNIDQDFGWPGNGKSIDLIEYVAVDLLRPYQNHARLHSQEKIKRLRANINEFGFLVPVIVDANCEVIAGHARLQAAIELGFESIPVIRVCHLTDAQVKAFRIADNRLVELADWDASALATEFEVILGAGLDIELTGFQVPEIDLFLLKEENDAADEIEEADDELPIGDPVSAPGDVWLLGDHRLVCGNSLEQNVFHQIMGDDLAAMVLSDPPYNVRVRGHVSGRGRVQHKEFRMASGEMDDNAFLDFLRVSLANAMRNSDANAPLFIFMDWRHADTLQRAAQQVGLKQLNLCVWIKSNAGMGSFYRSQHELVFVFSQKDARVRNNIQLGKHGRNRTNVWTQGGANTFGGETRGALAEHPTPKPVKLLADAILDVTRPGEVVLDMFLGGGATLIACERTKRRCRGIEIDPAYVDVTVRRWQKETGRAAHLQSTNETFEDLSSRRRQGLTSPKRGALP